jgi:uncharacterized membrane protein YfcA
MLFPNAEIIINPFVLVLLGLLVGTLSGFFGIGGGFLITGSLLVLGVPPLFAVGTGITLVMGTSIISTLKHRELGNVDIKFGICLISGTMPAIFIAERLNQFLAVNDLSAPVIKGLYVILLSSVGMFIIYDSLKSYRKAKNDNVSEATKPASKFLRELRIGPEFIYIPFLGKKSTYLNFPVAQIESMSILVIVMIGFIIGFIAGLLGAGGGFILMPVLIYFIGIPTTVAIGTDLMQVIVTGSLGTFLYALSDNVDIVMASLMLVPAFFLSQVGALATKYVRPDKIRIIYGLLLTFGGLSVALEYASSFMGNSLFIRQLAICILLGSASCISLWILGLFFKGYINRNNKVSVD